MKDRKFFTPGPGGIICMQYNRFYAKIECMFPPLCGNNRKENETCEVQKYLAKM
jgi:hypothetical protein